MHYDSTLPLILCTDALDVGVSAVLMQRYDNTLKPISASSCRLIDAEKKYSTIDKEALAIIYGINKCQQYVYGRRFTIWSDHKPLEYILGNYAELPKIATNRLARWAIILSGHDYSIE